MTDNLKVMAWGLVFQDSTIMHALPDPTDIGDTGPAVCGHGSASGWTEPQGDKDYFWCNPCVTTLQTMDKNHQLDRETVRELKLLDLI